VGRRAIAWVDHIVDLPIEWDSMYPKPLRDVSGPDGLLPWVIPPEEAEIDRNSFLW
jgi:hypothetical protein